MIQFRVKLLFNPLGRPEFIGFKWFRIREKLKCIYVMHKQISVLKIDNIFVMKCEQNN